MISYSVILDKTNSVDRLGKGQSFLRDQEQF